MSNVALVPMIASEATGPRFYYGNNVKLMQRGTNQALVRLQPSLMLGKGRPGHPVQPDGALNARAQHQLARSSRRWCSGCSLCEKWLQRLGVPAPPPLTT
jgi:hypothetical protein